jgi:hypothetical protein
MIKSSVPVSVKIEVRRHSHDKAFVDDDAVGVMVTWCRGFSLAAASPSLSLEPIRNVQAGIITNSMPMLLV